MSCNPSDDRILYTFENDRGEKLVKMFDCLNTNVEVCKNKHEKLKITCGCLFGINLLHADYITMSVVNRFRLTKIIHKKLHIKEEATRGVL